MGSYRESRKIHILYYLQINEWPGMYISMHYQYNYLIGIGQQNGPHKINQFDTICKRLKTTK